jgi:hypothetical protein
MCCLDALCTKNVSACALTVSIVIRKKSGWGRSDADAPPGDCPSRGKANATVTRSWRGVAFVVIDNKDLISSFPLWSTYHPAAIPPRQKENQVCRQSIQRYGDMPLRTPGIDSWCNVRTKHVFCPSTITFTLFV